MSHALRALEAGLTHHVTAHAIPSRLCFPDDRSRGSLRQILAHLADRAPVEIHAFAMMDNHLHLLLTTLEVGAVATALRVLLASHAMRLNRALGQAGPLWHDRYANVVIRHDDHALRACLYIDANPWRAGLVSHPRHSDWTSYLALAEGQGGEFLVPHPVLMRLGADSAERQRAYRDLMTRYLREARRIRLYGKIPPGPDPLGGLRICQVRNP